MHQIRNAVNGHGFAAHYDSGSACPVCGRSSGNCKLTHHGLVVCRDADNANRADLRGFVYLGLSANPAFGLYRHPGAAALPYDPDHDPDEARTRRALAQARKLSEWIASVLLAPASPNDLGRALRLPLDAALCEEVSVRFVANHGFGRGGPAWAFPMVDGAGHLVGASLRTRSGGKFTVGSGNGIFVPLRVHTRFPGEAGARKPLFLVEGASDTLALTTTNLFAVGRPSNVGGVIVLAEWIKNYLPRQRWDLVVVGENDARYGKANERIWPGRDGGLQTAHGLAELLGIRVRFTLAPVGVKDCRDWIVRELGKRGATSGNVGVRLFSELLAEYRCEMIDPGRPYQPRPIPAGVLPYRERPRVEVRPAGRPGHFIIIYREGA
jgi:hypothetical protein